MLTGLCPRFPHFAPREYAVPLIDGMIFPLDLDIMQNKMSAVAAGLSFHYLSSFLIDTKR